MAVMSRDSCRTDTTSAPPVAYLFALITLFLCQLAFTAESASSLWTAGAQGEAKPALSHALATASYASDKQALLRLATDTQSNGSDEPEALQVTALLVGFPSSTSLFPRDVPLQQMRASMAHPGAARAPPVSPAIYS